ncbi:MAG: ABC transporter permease [Chloroflexi bacterium]|nr:ABC transporter permease [Chloroflexota bacterium]
MKTRSLPLQIGLIVVPVALALLLTALLILAVGADPLAVFQTVWEGATRDSRSFGQVVNFWMPLTLVGVGLIVTFTAGLWNIGVEGQMVMGAVFATWAALSLDLPQPLLVAVEILLALLGGGLWAALVGVLKTRLGVHEIFGGVALNALANVLLIYLISGPWQPPEGGSVRGTPPFPDAAIPTFLSDTFKVSLVAILIVLAAAVAVVLALRGTRWGLELKATGKNARSALLLGVPTRRAAMSAFIVCGALAGVAGLYRVLFTFVSASLRPGVSGGIGFLGVLVVLLVAVRPLGVPLVTFIFALVLGGSARLQIALGLDASLAGVLQGSLVLIVLLFNGLRGRLAAREEITEAAAHE